MVTRLMMDNPPEMIPVLVPALEITRSMIRIDIPIQIDGCDPQSFPRGYLLDLGVIRAVP